ncbi:fusaric acid resistance protein, partial [Methylobacterium frigidaeris]|uniref:FUSC family protein n=1 Tax=Methylobacterium frigidaeris TaxID=2038277 RepID=UPI000C42A2BE
MMLPGWRQWLFAVKVSGAALLALGIALWVDLPRPYWAMATVYITMQPLSGATRSKALYRVVGTLIGVTAAVVLVPPLVNAPEVLTLALALWTAACLYLSLLDRSPRSYLFMLAGYTAALIGFPAVTSPETIFDTAVSRAEEI